MQYRKFSLNADLKGLFLDIHGKRGCKFGDSKTRGCPLSKREGGCSFAVGTQPQRVSAPPPPPTPLYPGVLRRFLRSTCEIGTPPSRAPLLYLKTATCIPSLLSCPTTQITIFTKYGITLWPPPYLLTCQI